MTPDADDPGPSAATDGDVPRRARGRPGLRRDEPLRLDELLRAARALIAVEGLDGLSIRKVADSLQVAPAALYNHVGSKRELVELMIEQVWDEVVATVPADPTDLLAWIVESNVAILRAWLANLELAPLASAAPEVNEQFWKATELFTGIFQAAGFEDVPRAYAAVQSFTMGAVALAANRAAASAYFSREPKEAVVAANRHLDARGASADLRGVVEARFTVVTEAQFADDLRALLDALPRR